MAHLLLTFQASGRHNGYAGYFQNPAEGSYQTETLLAM
jgi:hypothetical protein